MIDTHETVASRQNRYRRLMRKAEQLEDPILVRLILQKLTINGGNGYEAATDKGAIIQFPNTLAPAKTNNCEPLILESPAIKQTSLRDLLVALLIFSGSILLPLQIPIFFHYGRPY